MDGGYTQHDNRVGGPVRRGGSRGGHRGGRPRFTRGGRGSRGRGEVNPRTRLEDDYNMAEDEGTSRGRRRFQPYTKGRAPSNEAGGSVFGRLGEYKSGGKSTAFQRPSGQGRGAGGASSSWHKVTVLKGGLEGRDWLVKQLTSRVSQPFQPVGEHVLGDKFMFFVAESAAALELKDIGSIESRNGTLEVLVKPSAPPRENRGGGHSEARPTFHRSGGGGGGGGGNSGRAGDFSMQEDSSEVIQRVLGQRYDPGTKFLNLSNMYNDPEFKQAGARVSMYDGKIVSLILSLVGQYCPDLISLDLSNNRLFRLDLYADLPLKCPELQTLDLSNNQLKSPEDVECVSGLTKLETLTLQGNPLSQNKDYVSLSGDMRKLFPALKQLDGQQLSSPVKFDLPVISGSLPPVQRSYFVNDEEKKLITTFLEQFYKMYDYDSRENLLSAYSSDAVFSLCVCTEGPRCQGLKEYIGLSRNLKKVSDSGRRLSMSKRGHLDIVQFLRDLPKTMHHSNTFIVDCAFSTPPYVSFVVNGLFSETEGRLSGSNPVIQFTRMFILTRVGSGVTITNDQFTLRGPTPQGLQSVDQSPQQGFVSSPPLLTGLSSAQMEAIQTLASQTRMNIEYSKRCLEENDWDFNKALTVFTVLQSEQKIPREAFIIS